MKTDRLHPNRRRNGGVLSIIASVSLVFAASISCGSEDHIAKTDTSNDRYASLRENMVVYQIEGRGVRNARVLAAMRKVPRHLFVPESERSEAYTDHPLPIGHEQTISQPYIVAIMSELLNLDPGAKVLEIGTGSGYQAAVLAELAANVYTIEIIPELARQAERTLREMGYRNIEVRCGDGFEGWPEQAPFDAIIVTAAPKDIPEKLVDQLRIGGRLVIPVGSISQELLRCTKTPKGLTTENIIPVRFVPMVGKEKK